MKEGCMMRGRIRRRPDGLLEIRRPRWRDALLTRDLATMAGLSLAWAVLTVTVVMGLVAAPLVVGVAGGVLAAVVCTARLGSALAVSDDAERDPSPPTGWAA